MMVDAVALVVALHEAGPDELRDRSAHVCPAGEADAPLNFRRDQPFGGCRVEWKLIAF